MGPALPYPTLSQAMPTYHMIHPHPICMLVLVTSIPFSWRRFILRMMAESDP